MTRRCTVVLLAAAALAGCRGDEPKRAAPATTRSDRLTLPEYRREANAICKRANREIRGLDQPDTPGELREFVGDARPIFSDAIDGLAELRPPVQLDRAHDRWLTQNRRVLAKLDDLEDAGLTEVLSRARDFARLNDEAVETAERRLGLTDCATT